MRKLIFSALVATITSTSIFAQTHDSTASNQTATPATSNSASASGDVTQAIAQSGYNAMITAAIKTAGLESTLQGAGPFTIFAPADQAFAAGSKADSLLKDPAKLAPVLRNHVVTGKYTKDDIIKALTVGRGTTTLTTIDGAKLTLKVNASKNLELSDAAGNTALVTVFDLKGTNGVAHVINNVLLPQK